MPLGIETVRAAGDTASVAGEPTVSASAPNARFEPGQTGQLQINLTNDAVIQPDTETHPPEAIERAGQARSVRVAISDTGDAPITVATGPRSADTIENGETTGPFSFDVAVDEDAKPGIYEVDVTTQYRHAKRVEYNETDTGNIQYNETVVRKTDTDTITVAIQRKPQFEVEYVTHDVPLGGQGTITMSITNTGEEDVTQSTVSLTSTDTDVYFGAGTASSEATVGEWKAGRSKRVEFRAGTVEEAVRREYPIDLTVQYTDSTNTRSVQNRQIGIEPEQRTEFEIESVEHNVPLDGEGTLSVTVDHDATKSIDDVTVTAATTESEVYIGSEASRTGRTIVKDWSRFSEETLKFRVGTTENAVNRSYPIELTFDYTDSDDNQNSRSATVEFTPKAQPQFTVESIDHNVPIGGTGQVAMTLTNEGPVDADSATLTINSNVDVLYFGSGGELEPIEGNGVLFEQSKVAIDPPQRGTPTSEAYIGDWPVGENRTVVFRAGFHESAINRSYVARVTTDFENEDGTDMPSQSTTIGLTPRSEIQFEYAAIESNLNVGEEGDLVGQITNLAERPIDGVVVTAENGYQGISIYNPKYAIGSLKPGETATYRFRVGVSEETEHGPRLFEMSTRYRDPEGNIRQTDSQDVAVAIEPSRDAFTIEAANATFTPGETDALVLEITNNRSETLSNVQAKLFTDDPLDSEDDSAFVSELEPGDSASVTMELSVGEEAIAKTYSASVDFRFDNARGDSELSDTYRVPITVEKSGGFAGTPILVSIIALGTISGVVGWRRNAFEQAQQYYEKRFGNSD